MSYLEKLKKLIGDDAFKKVKEDLGDKDLIINDGSYIPKEKFDAKLNEIKTLTADKEKLSGDLKKVQDDLKKLQDEKSSGNKTVEEKITALEKSAKDLEGKLQAKDKELLLARNEGILKDALTAAGVKNPKNLKLLMKEFDLNELKIDKDGKIEGWDGTVKKLQDDYKPLFGEEKISGTPPGGPGGTPPENMKEMSTEEFFESEVFGGGKTK